MLPAVPEKLLELESIDGLFLPAHDLSEWVKENIISEDGKLHNSDHAHLQQASVGFIWTNVTNVKGGRRILGTAQLGQPTGNAWTVGRQEQQLREWFGFIPDFVITLDAIYVSSVDTAKVLALIEHECYHLDMKRDEFGFPRFYKGSSMPMWALRGHDIEEFVGVVRRYGTKATYAEAFVAAALNKPEVAEATLKGICGTCAKVH